MRQNRQDRESTERLDREARTENLAEVRRCGEKISAKNAVLGKKIAKKTIGHGNFDDILSARGAFVCQPPFIRRRRKGDANNGEAVKLNRISFRKSMLHHDHGIHWVSSQEISLSRRLAYVKGIS